MLKFIFKYFLRLLLLLLSSSSLISQSGEFKRVLSKVICFFITQFVMYDTVHHKIYDREFCQRMRSTSFKDEQANLHN